MAKRPFVTWTTDKLRKDHWLVGITEHYNFYGKVRQDLFGFADLLCIKPPDTLAVQITDSGGNAQHIRDVIASVPAKVFLLAGNKIEIWAWRELIKKNLDGSKSKRCKWKEKITKIVYEDIEKYEQGLSDDRRKQRIEEEENFEIPESKRTRRV